MDENLQIFLLRIWREPRELENADPQWRGVIFHVVSGEHHYVKELDEIIEFIIPYLEGMEVSVYEYKQNSIWLKFKEALHKGPRQ